MRTANISVLSVAAVAMAVWSTAKRVGSAPGDIRRDPMNYIRRAYREADRLAQHDPPGIFRYVGPRWELEGATGEWVSRSSAQASSVREARSLPGVTETVIVGAHDRDGGEDVQRRTTLTASKTDRSGTRRVIARWSEYVDEWRMDRNKLIIVRSHLVRYGVSVGGEPIVAVRVTPAMQRFGRLAARLYAQRDMDLVRLGRSRTEIFANGWTEVWPNGSVDSRSGIPAHAAHKLVSRSTTIGVIVPEGSGYAVTKVSAVVGETRSAPRAREMVTFRVVDSWRKFGSRWLVTHSRILSARRKDFE